MKEYEMKELSNKEFAKLLIDIKRGVYESNGISDSNSKFNNVCSDFRQFEQRPTIKTGTNYANRKAVEQYLNISLL